MPQPYFEMEESRSVTPWVNRLYFESPGASSFLGLQLVKKRHKNLVPLLSGVKPDPMVRSGRYAEPIPVKSPFGELGRSKPFVTPPHICGTGEMSTEISDAYLGAGGISIENRDAYIYMAVGHDELPSWPAPATSGAQVTSRVGKPPIMAWYKAWRIYALSALGALVMSPRLGTRATLNLLKPSDAFIRRWSLLSSVQIMVCRPIGNVIADLLLL